MVSQQLNDAHLTIQQLQQNLNNNDDSVPRKIISMSKNFVNTDPYWKARKKELDALSLFHRKEYGDMISYFDTNSCAEYHWLPLHELLIKYHIQISRDGEDDVRQKFVNDTSFRHKLIMRNNHIVTHYFDTRLLNYMCSVGIELYDLCDYWFRYEFAAGRGMIHSHGVIFSLSHAEKIQNALNAFSSNSQGDSMNNDVALDLEKVLQSTELNDEAFYSPEFVSMHPAGGEIIDVNGIDEWVSDKSKWSRPEGTAEPVTDNPLGKNLESVLDLVNGIDNLHLDMCNKVGLHKCGNYCLKRVKSKTGDKSDDKRYCRFHFGEYDRETKRSSGKDIHPFYPLVTKGEHPRYEGKSDHPRFLQHIKCRMLPWNGNCDTQVIIEQFLLALQNYLTQYACKGASSTEDFIQTYRLLLDDSDESTTVKNLCQRLLLKIVGYVDVPDAAADFINTGGKLVRCTRNFNYVGLSGYRQVDTSGMSENLTRSNVLDKFLSDDRRASYPDITLYDWAKLCKKCKCQCMHVPVFTGARVYAVWPPTEEYSKTTLMCYSKGTWFNVDDLKSGFDTYLEAFADFLDSDDCPSVLKDVLLEAKEKYDRNQDKQNERTSTNNGSQNCSQDSVTSSQSSCIDGRIRMNFRDSIFNDIGMGQDLPDPNLQFPLNTGSDYKTASKCC